MFEIKRDNDFLLENHYTTTDIYYIEDMFTQIKMGENRLNYLFSEGYSAYDAIRQELICLVNCYELLREKTQGHNQYIEDKFSSRLKDARIKINKLLKQAAKLGITI